MEPAGRLRPGRPRTKAEVEDLLAERLGDRQPRLWWALRTFAPLQHAPTGGPWSFGPRSSFIAAPVRPPPEHPDESVRWLVRRYLEGFGPASVQDAPRGCCRCGTAPCSPTPTAAA